MAVDFGGMPRQQHGGRIVLADDRRAGDFCADGKLGAIVVRRVDPGAGEIAWPDLHKGFCKIGLPLLRQRLLDIGSRASRDYAQRNQLDWNMKPDTVEPLMHSVETIEDFIDRAGLSDKRHRHLDRDFEPLLLVAQI